MDGGKDGQRSRAGMQRRRRETPGGSVGKGNGEMDGGEGEMKAGRRETYKASLRGGGGGQAILLLSVSWLQIKANGLDGL